MNTAILRKCIVELQQPEPRLDYIRGMLETLVEVTDKESEKYLEQKNIYQPPYTITSNPTTTNEAAIMEARARAAVDSIKAMSEASSHE